METTDNKDKIDVDSVNPVLQTLATTEMPVVEEKVVKHKKRYTAPSYKIHYNEKKIPIKKLRRGHCSKEALEKKKQNLKYNKPKEEQYKIQQKAQVTNKANKLIEGAVIDKVREAMCESKAQGDTVFYEKFINTFLDTAAKDPNSKCGVMLQSSIFNQDLLKKLDSERNSAMARDVSFTRYNLSQTLFPEQKNVLVDTTSKNIIVICGRRQGKTELDARLLVNKCIEPNSPCFYIHLTFQNAISQEYELVKKAQESCSLVIKRESRSDGIIEFANGSTIRFRGVNNEQEQQKILGYKQKLVIIDEVQNQRSLKNLIDVIVQPLLQDYKDSQLVCTGTPPRTPGTYCEVLWNSPFWRKYRWNMLSNPYIPDADATLDRICTEKGITREDSFIKREYLGIVGAYDTEAQVMKGYQTYEGTIPPDFIPDELYEGVDFGFSDQNAFVSLVVNKAQRRGYVLYESTFNKQTIQQIVDEAKKMHEQSIDFMKSRNPSYDIGRASIYCDTNEESISYSMFTDYHLPARNCYKYDKQLQLSQLAEEFRTGRCKIKAKGSMEEEFTRTVYKRDELDNILPEIDDSVFHPNLIFQLLYASRQYFYDIGIDAGGTGTTEWSK